MIYFEIFLYSFALNLIWEFSHCNLYTTCLKMKKGPRNKLLIIMSVKDGLWITFFYIITVFLFGETNILVNPIQLGTFIGLTLLFAYIDERISIAKGRWEYAKTMPTFFKVGISPLLELGLTGVISFVLVFIL
jgi:hypothetical protein